MACVTLESAALTSLSCLGSSRRRLFHKPLSISLSSSGGVLPARRLRVRMGLTPDGPSVAVVGVTGAVGQEFLEVLASRDFPYSAVKMLASKRSAGQKLEFEVCTTGVPWGNKRIATQLQYCMQSHIYAHILLSMILL